MHNPLRRLSSAWAGPDVLPSPSSPPSSPPPDQKKQRGTSASPPTKHHRHLRRHAKNYDVQPLGGNRPIDSASAASAPTTAVNRTSVMATHDPNPAPDRADDVARRKEERRAHRQRERLRERERELSSSLPAAELESKSSESGGSSRSGSTHHHRHRHHRDHDAHQDRLRDRDQDRKHHRDKGSGVARPSLDKGPPPAATATAAGGGEPMESPGSVSSLNSSPSPAPAPAPEGVAIAIPSPRTKHDVGGRGPSTPIITTTPPTPSPLEQARRRNTRPVSLIAPSHTTPPYPSTPPASSSHIEANTADYLAYHPQHHHQQQQQQQQHQQQQQQPFHLRSAATGLGINILPPALRSGSPASRPRASTTPSASSAPAALRPCRRFPTSPTTTTPSAAAATATPTMREAAVEIGSSGSIAQRRTGRKEDPYLMLKRFDTVLVVDDSASMAEHWEATREALEMVASVALQHDDDGIDIHFMNHPEHDAWNVRSAVHIRRLFALVQPAGITPTGQCLDEILREYIDRYAASSTAPTRWPPGSPDSAASTSSLSSTHAPTKPPPPKPLNIVVLTDGEPTDSPEPVIVWAARKLESLNAPLHQVGIQFLQIGNEEGAREALEELDDALADIYGIRDMVDTTRYVGAREPISGDVLLKALLGGINRRLDRLRL